MTPSPETSFSNFFSVDDFSAFVVDYAGQTSAGRNDTYRKMIDATMRPALAKFIGILLDGGRLVPLPGTDGRRGNLMDAWNGLFSDIEETRQRSLDFIAQRFAHSFLFFKVYDAAAAGTKLAVAENYAKMVEAVDAGNLPWWNTMVEDYCFNSGDRFKVEFDGWKLRMGAVNKGRLLPMEDVPAPAPVEIEVEFETGEVLVSDWFRIEEFIDSVQAAEDRSIDINSAAGCVQRTEEYARKFGFVSVFVGNSSPKVFNVDGVIVIGRAEDEYGRPTISSVGCVITDLWWVSMIDRRRLTDIVAEALGRAKAEEAVAAYIEEDDTMTLTVAPGRHRLYFAGAPDIFADRFHSPDLKLDETMEPMFVMSPRPLEITEKPSTAMPIPGGA